MGSRFRSLSPRLITKCHSTPVDCVRHSLSLNFDENTPPLQDFLSPCCLRQWSSASLSWGVQREQPPTRAHSETFGVKYARMRGCNYDPDFVNTSRFGRTVRVHTISDSWNAKPFLSPFRTKLAFSSCPSNMFAIKICVILSVTLCIGCVCYVHFSCDKHKPSTSESRFLIPTWYYHPPDVEISERLVNTKKIMLIRSSNSFFH